MHLTWYSRKKEKSILLMIFCVEICYQIKKIHSTSLINYRWLCGIVAIRPIVGHCGFVQVFLDNEEKGAHLHARLFFEKKTDPLGVRKMNLPAFVTHYWMFFFFFVVAPFSLVTYFSVVNLVLRNLLLSNVCSLG